MENTKVSIIVPVYNAEKWLKRCVDSILNQTLKEIELILVNDGSTDNSGALCDQFAGNDARIRVIHTENGGPSKARNIGMKNAYGEYITFADADDEVQSDMYEAMYKIAHKQNTEADIVMCNILFKTQDEERILNHNFAETYDGNEKIREEVLIYFYIGGCGGLYAPCNRLFRRSFLKQHGIEFDQHRSYAEDLFFNFYTMKNADLIRTTDAPYYIYHQDNLSSITHTFRKNFYFECKRDQKELLEQAQEMALELDWEKFWNIFANKAYQQIFETIGRDADCKEKVMQILKDDMLYQAASYRYTSFRGMFTILNKLIKMRWYQLAWIVSFLYEKVRKY